MVQDEFTNTSRRRGWTCYYRDGTVVEDLTHSESFDLFQLALSTDNTCTVHPPYIEYKAP